MVHVKTRIPGAIAKAGQLVLYMHRLCQLVLFPAPGGIIVLLLNALRRAALLPLLTSSRYEHRRRC